MTGAKTNTKAEGNQPPPIRRDAGGLVEPSSLADAIQWFLDFDQRVAFVRYPSVESLFQWRQSATLSEQPDSYAFASAEDRLAVGIMQALKEYDTERGLHGWVGELLAALDDARQTSEAVAGAYGLTPGEGSSVLGEAEKIPSARERAIYLNCCWLVTLCTAEARVLGWAYQSLYGRPFRPENF